MAMDLQPKSLASIVVKIFTSSSLVTEIIASAFATLASFKISVSSASP